MCGRYASTKSNDELSGLYGALPAGEGVADRPSWNVAPTQAVRVVLEHQRAAGEPVEPQLRAVRWGLVPSWSKDPKSGGRLINARAESITQKPSFRKAAAKQRCVLPADGYYEWEAGPDGKQTYFLRLENQILNMAGLYALWRDESKDEKDPARWLWSATVVTTTVILPHTRLYRP